MKHMLFLVVLLFMVFTTQAQHWQWERQNTGGSTCAQPIYASDAEPVVATDRFGGVYLSGGLISPTGFTVATISVSFGSHTVVDTAWGIFIAKFDTFGNIKWLKNITGSGTYATSGEPNCLFADSAGNLYLTGYSGDSILKIGSYVMHKDPSFDQFGFFIAKFDSGGNFLWAKQVDPEGHGYHLVYRSYLALDKSGNVIAAVQGGYSNQFDTISIPSPYLYTGCVAKYSPEGAVLWAKSFTSPGGCFVKAVTTDGDDNVIVGGIVDNSLLYGADTLPVPGALDSYRYHIFLLKYDSAGNNVWAKVIAGNGSDTITSMIADGADNIYVNGYGSSSYIHADTATLVHPQWFLLRLSPTGQAEWWRTGYIVDTMFSDEQHGPGYVTADGGSSLYMAGTIFGYRFITGFDTVNLPCGFGAVALKTDTAGNIRWGIAACGPFTNSIAAGVNGQVYTAASYMYPGAVIYGLDTLYALSSPGSAVLAKIDTSLALATPVVENTTGNILLFPNPSGSEIFVSIPAIVGNTFYVVTDIAGREMLRTKIIAGTTSFNLDISSLVLGCYILVVQSENGNTYRNKFVKY